MRQRGRADGLRRVTIEDVAAAARVSTATVSRFLAQPATVSARLAQRVRGAVIELGYVPNPAARALSSLRSGLVGVMVDELEERAAIVQALVAALALSQRATVLQRARTRAEVDAAVRTLVERDVEGVIAIGLTVSFAAAELMRARSMRWVDASDEPFAAAAAERVVGALTALDHRFIGVLSPPCGVPYAAAVEAAVTDAGMQFERCAVHAEQVRGVLAAWSDALAAPTALICATDLLAVAAIQAASVLGVRVPRDISVIGYGDQPFGAWTAPPLTTVRLPVPAMADHLVGQLLRTGGSHVVAKPKIVMRRSLDQAPRST